MSKTDTPAKVGSNAVLGLMLIAAALLAGCEQHPSKSPAYWTPEQLDAWVDEARKNCKPNGYAIDAARDTKFVMREVLLCPDGTLRIVPIR